MKKLISGLTALAIMAVPITVFAEEATARTITESSDPQKADAVITTEIDPTFVVTIPADTKVPFNSTATEFGNITLTKARLDPGKVVRVELETRFTLKNKADNKKKIPYDITYLDDFTDPENPKDLSFKEWSVILEEQGESVPLTIRIEEAEWNKAYAGVYSDTVTFNVEYTDADEAEES